MTYPEGVEVRGKSLRIFFMYKGQRCRETLKGWLATPGNIKKAGRLRAVIVADIASGEFDYALRFPNSKKARVLGGAENNGLVTTLSELVSKWIRVKEPTCTKETLNRTRHALATCARILDGRRPIANITHEDALTLRRDLLNGETFFSRKRNKKGRSVSTVNTYISLCSELFAFAVRAGYVTSNPFDNVGSLTLENHSPEPLEFDEFERLVTHPAADPQSVNLWTLAVYTGLRHGELCALAWEDIDLDARTITIRRNLTVKNRFKTPKTKAGERTVNLLTPAVDALKRQKLISFLRPANEISVALRQQDKQRTDRCTWVFVTGLSANSRPQNCGYLSTSGINRLWHIAVKRAGIRFRNPYQTRHTYACWMLSKGANPAFIASQMGHKDMTMVLKVYGAWMPSANVSEIEKMNEAFKSDSPSKPHFKKKL